MRVSVILCTYAESMYEDFTAAAKSILTQTYDHVELVVVVDGNDSLYEMVNRDFAGREDVVLYCNDKNRGLSESRNIGVELSSGDVVAFMDDDAVADPRWIEELVSAYREHDVIAAGGKMTPKWVAGKPSFLPEEFYWLVGVTHRGFADGPGEVRNTFGSNISFRRKVFEELGGFDIEMGRQGDKNLQSEETLLCAEMKKEFEQGVWYNPDAIVEHKVFEYRTKPKWLLERAFWQGYSKRAMTVLLPDSGSEETVFLNELLFKYIPERIRNALLKLSVIEALKLLMLIVFTSFVGFGYLYGLTKWR